jgi:uncharacterized HAD superfamily protein
MKIGIDFDGVIVKVDEEARTIIADLAARSTGIKIIDPAAALWPDRYDEIEGEKAEVFIPRYFRAVADYEETPAGKANMKSMPNVKEAITQLKQTGNELYLITARGGTDILKDEEHARRAIKLVRGKLDEIGVSFDKYCFGRMEKVSTALELGLDCMIDDKYSHAEALAGAGIPVFQLLTPGSPAQKSAADIDGVTAVNDWKEIVEKIAQLQNQTKLSRLTLPHDLSRTDDKAALIN